MTTTDASHARRRDVSAENVRSALEDGLRGIDRCRRGFPAERVTLHVQD
jgi:hypothetical protein